MRRRGAGGWRTGLPRAAPAWVTAVVLGVSFTAPLAPIRVWAQASAPSSPPAADDEEAQRRRMEALRKQAEEKRLKAHELKGKEQKVLGDLRATEGRLRKTRQSIQQLTRRESGLQHELSGVRTDLNRSQSALAARRTRLADRLRGLYKLGRSRELEFLLASESFAQLLLRVDYLTRVARQDRVLMLAIDEEKNRIDHNRRRLDRTLGEVEQTSARRQQERRELDRLRVRKQQTVHQIQNEREAYEAAAAELDRTARRIQGVLAELERRRREEEARRKGETGKPPPGEAYRGEFVGARGRLSWPVRGELVGRFGNEKHPKFNTETFNSGIDISAPLGSDIRAVARGRTDFVDSDFGAYGQTLILNHGDGYYTVYAHCSAVLVSRGQEVESGQVVARVGDTGSIKGSILHFEVRKGRQALNPLDWLR